MGDGREGAEDGSECGGIRERKYHEREGVGGWREPNTFGCRADQKNPLRIMGQSSSHS